MKTMILLLLVIIVSASAQTVTDIDGNVYKTVKVGNQVWMAENLKTTKYKNGDPIPNVIDNVQWDSIRTGAYCYYNNNPSNANAYGSLYNWYAVNDSRRLAPEGWHIPTYSEWEILINFLGGDGVAGGKLKETGTTHWQSPNIGATNEIGFTALPGGMRGPTGSFRAGISNMGFWWSITGSNQTGAKAIIAFMNNKIAIVRGYTNLGHAFSIRCVKDGNDTSSQFKLSQNYPSTEINSSKEAPSQFGLSQNYPNPFNPSTIISYFVGMNNNSSVLVQLTVYDVLGREIVCLVNEEKQPGLYQVKFDGTNLPNGIYYYKLQTEKYTEMKKMIFLK